MVVLIPILLSSAVFTKLAIRELNLPPAKGGGVTTTDQKPDEEKKRLNLTVLVSKKGKEDGTYNYEELQKKLVEIKQKIAGQGFTDENNILISAEKDIAYKYIVKVMDYVSTYTELLNHFMRY